MPDTSRLYSQSDEAKHQLKCIERARKRAYAQIESIAHELMLETGCSAADANILLDHAHDGLDDMLCDVTARWENEKDEADNAIGNIEERDLMLSRPVW
jgi:hypothetical protein